MAEDIQDQGTSASDSATQGAGEAFNPNDFVTPELQSKFDSVFGGTSKAGDAADDNKGEAAQTKQSVATTSRRRARAASEDDEGLDDSLAPAQDGSVQDQQQLDEPLPVRQPKVGNPRQPAQTNATGEEAAATLDPALRHAARRAGWDDASIDELHGEKPELAQATFGRFLRSFNELSAQFAQLGQNRGQQGFQQQGNQQQVQQPPTQLPVTQQQGANPLEAMFGPQRWKAINDAYGTEFVSNVLEPLRDSVIVPMQQMQRFYAAQMQQAQVSEANNFFTDVTKGSDYGDLYGPNDRTKRTTGQEQARYELATTADAIRSGFAQQGIDLSVAEALERAFMMKNADRFAETERKKLTNAVQRRSRQITARPTQRGAAPRQQQGRSLQTAEQAYAQRLADLGIDENG